MITTKVTCDHCGAELQNYIGKLWKASFLTIGKDDIDDIHACTKEHLGLAIAKTFGIPTDSTAATLIAEADERTANAWKNLEENINARNTAEVRITELETEPANVKMQKMLTREIQPMSRHESASITDPSKPTKPAFERCLICGGSGRVESEQTHMMMQAVSCRACNGTGEIP